MEVKAVAQGLINDVDQDVVQYAKFALAQVDGVVRATRFATKLRLMEWKVLERILSYYCTCCSMISTSSYGTCISRP